jgi:hypothetical protein
MNHKNKKVKVIYIIKLYTYTEIYEPVQPQWTINGPEYYQAAC